MTPTPQRPDDRRRALLVVRNTFEHDARVQRAAHKLDEMGFQVTVLAALWDTRTEARSPRRERRGPVNVLRVGPPALLRRLYGAARDRIGGHSGTPEPRGRSAALPSPAPRRANRAKGLVRRAARWLRTADFYARVVPLALRLRPDLVHCNDYNTMWVGVVARLASPRTALVYDSHEIWADRNLRPEPRWWLLLCELLFVRVAHEVVMTSPAHAEVLARRNRIPMPTVVRNIPSRAESVGNGAEPAAGIGEVAPAGRDGDGPVVAYAGILLRHRGLEQSIRALASLEDARLRLLGPVAPDYRAELEDLARASGVAHRVEFAAPVPASDVVANLSRADAGLALFQPNCLSHRLVLPNKLFEYAHAGLPIVGSDLPMIARFVEEHGLGTVVDAEDPDAIARGLAEVLSPDRHERLAEAARRAGAELDWERESELLAGAYNRALARASA